jgi:parallel beta-helix repeat protein
MVTIWSIVTVPQVIYFFKTMVILMIRRIVAVWLVLVLLFTCILIIDVSTVVITKVSGDTLYVGGSGLGNYSSIQSAITDAITGDTVYVYNGTYNENVIVNRTINLMGEDKEITFINGGGSGDVVRIVANWTNVTGFSIQGSGSTLPDAGMELNNVHNCNVSDNNLINNYKGIYLLDSYDNDVYLNLATSNSYVGIHLENSNQNDIVNNYVLSNYGGMMLSYSDSNNIISNNASLQTDNNGIGLSYSNGNTIAYNNASSNEGDGIILSWSDGNDIIENALISNHWSGVFLWDDSDGNDVIGNTARDNYHGILIFDYSDNNVIIENNIQDNDYGIEIMDFNSGGNVIYHNNFLYNSIQASDSSNIGNQWDNGYPSGGNYWSDYIGDDEYNGPAQNIPGSDGIGDSAFLFFGDVDSYPLMYPYGNCIFLYPGWNLISIPLIQIETNIDKVLLPINGSYDSVQWFNTSDKSDHWKHNHNLKPQHLNDLDDIEHRMGVWIHFTEPGKVLFEYQGTLPSHNQTIQLHKGWNMVGYPSLSRRTRTEGLNNLTFGTHVDAIWTYDPSIQKWVEMDQAQDHFLLGRGYWIHTTQECEWDVPL